MEISDFMVNKIVNLDYLERLWRKSLALITSDIFVSVMEKEINQQYYLNFYTLFYSKKDKDYVACNSYILIDDCFDRDGFCLKPILELMEESHKSIENYLK